MKTKDKQFGAFAEKMASEMLLKKGYTIRENNWRPKNSHLEVDIIAQRDDTLAFVEVKARGKTAGNPAEAVDEKKRRRLIRAADMYLRSQPLDYYFRFDIITVSGTIDDYEIEHLEDAFLPDIYSPY